MTIPLKPIALAAALTGAGLVAIPAFADRDEIRAMQDAKVSLIEAIQAAEASEGGKAYEASIDDDSFRPEYEVTILRDDRVYDVRVNAETGEVIGAREDLDD